MLKRPVHCARGPAAVLAGCLALLPALAGAADAGVVTIEGRQWATRSNGPYITWPEADRYCADLVLGGYEDWRLPNLMELDALYDPEAPSGIRSPIDLEGCCLWSRTSLADRRAEEENEIALAPERYRWGFMFDGGSYYYAVPRYKDGKALCTRDD